ncbi:hypothetical protein RRG08_000058, partial [Elysia crispata]
DRVALTRGSPKKGLVWSFGPSLSHQGKPQEWLGVEFWTESLSPGEAPRTAWCGVLDRVALTRGSPKKGLVWSFGPSLSHQGPKEWLGGVLGRVALTQEAPRIAWWKEWLGVEFWTESLSPQELGVEFWAEQGKSKEWLGVEFLDRVALIRGSLKNGFVWSFGPSRSHQSFEGSLKNGLVWSFGPSRSHHGKSKEWLGVEFWTESLSSGEV